MELIKVEVFYGKHTAQECNTRYTEISCGKQGVLYKDGSQAYTTDLRSRKWVNDGAAERLWNVIKAGGQEEPRSSFCGCKPARVYDPQMDDRELVDRLQKAGFRLVEEKIRTRSADYWRWVLEGDAEAVEKFLDS